MHLYQIFKNNCYVSERYQPGYYDGEILLFDVVKPHHKDDWTKYCNKISRQKLPGNHFNVLNERKAVGKIIDNLLRVEMSFINSNDIEFVLQVYY